MLTTLMDLVFVCALLVGAVCFVAAVVMCFAIAAELVRTSLRLLQRMSPVHGRLLPSLGGSRAPIAGPPGKPGSKF